MTKQEAISIMLDVATKDSSSKVREAAIILLNELIRCFLNNCKGPQQ
jgi:hypothetical protein